MIYLYRFPDDERLAAFSAMGRIRLDDASVPPVFGVAVRERPGAAARAGLTGDTGRAADDAGDSFQKPASR
jgi:hypothetical protein